MVGVAALLLSASLAGAASASAFTNGSFETPGAPDPFSTLATGNTTINGWTVGLAGIDYIGNYWQASDGNSSLDMSALDAGSIRQTFDTILGQRYNVLFDLAGNFNPGYQDIKNLRVDAGGATYSDYAFDITGTGPSNMGWRTESYGFTAAGSSTTLTFTSLTHTAGGAALDNVRVSAAVPEPASWALMVIGFGGLGAALRSRRRLSTATA